MTTAKAIPLVALCLALAATTARAENFSCTFGRGACLDYGDTVCSSRGKCVSDDAICFESYTCGFGGFICKSKFDVLASTYDDLVSDYNDLVVKAKAIASDYDELAGRHNDLIDEFETLQRRHTEAVACVAAADTLDEAQNCAWP